MFLGRITLAAAIASAEGQGLASAVVAQSITMTYAHSENPSATTAAIAFEAMIEGKSGGDIRENQRVPEGQSRDPRCAWR